MFYQGDIFRWKTEVSVIDHHKIVACALVFVKVYFHLLFLLEKQSYIINVMVGGTYHEINEEIVFVLFLTKLQTQLLLLHKVKHFQVLLLNQLVDFLVHLDVLALQLRRHYKVQSKIYLLIWFKKDS